jgi:hypothetical protein
LGYLQAGQGSHCARLPLRSAAVSARFSQAKGSSSRLEKLSILDLINYRQHIVNDFYLVVDPG